MGVQAFLSEAPVERFDECIVDRPASPAEVERDVALVGPAIESVRDKLGTVVDPNPLWCGSGRRTASRMATTFSPLMPLPVLVIWNRNSSL